MKTDSSQEQLKEMLHEAKNYYDLQKEYVRLTMAEQLTKLLSAIAFAVLATVLIITIVMFLGLALVHWIGEAIGNMALCYAIFALFIAIILVILYVNKRKYFIVPIARTMSKIFLMDDENESSNNNNDESDE